MQKFEEYLLGRFEEEGDHEGVREESGEEQEVKASEDRQSEIVYEQGRELEEVQYEHFEEMPKGGWRTE